MSAEGVGIGKPGWPWPETLDALVAAPENHSVLFENERVRVIQTHILPGQTVPVHTHRWPSVMFILSWSDLIRLDEQGHVLLDTRQAAEAPNSMRPRGSKPCRRTGCAT